MEVTRGTVVWNIEEGETIICHEFISGRVLKGRIGILGGTYILVHWDSRVFLAPFGMVEAQVSLTRFLLNPLHHADFNTSFQIIVNRDTNTSSHDDSGYRGAA